MARLYRACEAPARAALSDPLFIPERPPCTPRRAMTYPAGHADLPAAGRDPTARSVALRDATALRMFRLLRPRFARATIDSLYGVIVAQARDADFYRRLRRADRSTAASS